MFEDFQKLPILGILRGITEHQLENIFRVSKNGGLNSIEITMNTKHAPILISKMKKIAGKDLHIGAGTVLNMNDLEAALNAGAEFIVTPTTNRQVIEHCKHAGIPIFPGALTPTEVLNAWELGATMVKIFPLSIFGPAYIKELKGPLNEIKMLACGGISPKNISNFFSVGTDAVAFGGSIFSNETMSENKWDDIEKAISTLINAYLHQ